MSIVHDVRDTWRSLGRSPYFTIPVILSLAFAIGANVAAFSLVNTLILRPLPVREPDRLFQITYAGERGQTDGANYSWYEEVRDRSRSISAALLSFRRASMKVKVEGRVEALTGQRVSGSFFSALGIDPQIGRFIEPADETGGAPQRVAVIGDAYWSRKFGRDPSAIGRTIVVDDVPHVIVGVSRPGFFGLEVGGRIDVTVPIDGSQYRQGWLSMALLVRIPDDQAPSAAAEELTTLLREFAKSEPARARLAALRVELLPAANGLAGLRNQYTRPAMTIMALVGMMLLLACANWATLSMARASARQRDQAIRLALGSSRFRLARQQLVESLLLALTAGAIGFVAASWAVRLLTTYLPGAVDLRIESDATVVLFTLAASLLTGTLFGIAPASLTGGIQARHLRASSGTGDGGRAGVGAVLVVAQVALSIVLVVAATFFVATLRNLRGQEMGFSGDGVLTFSLDSEGTDLEGERLAAVHRQILETLRAIPGVRSATLATVSPLSGNEDGKSISIPGFVPRSPDDLDAQVNTIGPDYLTTFAIPLVRGRGITADDVAGAPHVALVNESAAKYYFPGADPIGRHMEIRGATTLRPEIVGVVADVMYGDLRTSAGPIFYVPAFQRLTDGEFVFAARTAAGSADALALQVQREVSEVVPLIPVLGLKSVARHIDERLVNERLLATMSAVFGVLALLVAGIGIYGIVAYSVSRRTPELGLRLALGAARPHVLWLVLRSTLVVVAIGSLLGVAGAVAASDVVTRMLFGIPPTDPRVYAAAVSALTFVGVAACIAPTMRAVRIQPAIALKSE